MHWKKNSSCCTLQISLLFKTQRALPSNPPIPLKKMVWPPLKNPKVVNLNGKNSLAQPNLKKLP